MERRTTYELNGKVYEGRGARAAGGLIVQPSYVAFLARSVGARSIRYMIATADHESDFTANEIDYEEPDEHGHVFVSKGLYQQSDEEATTVGMRGANLCDPAVATLAFNRLVEHNYDAFLRALPHSLALELDATDDRWAYLALYHNEGPGRFATTDEKGRHSGALTTIFNNGIDWAAYERRNAGRGICQYGRDCITGGPHWAAISASRS